MKFRCKMIDTAAMRDFTNFVNVVSKMSKICVIRLTPDELCFNVSDDGTPVLWAELSHKHFFNEYLVVGVTDVQNEIYLEFDAIMLGRSLNSLKQTARSAKIKLTNKQQPCLTIEVELPSIANESCQCTHDVPVRVIPRREWPLYQAPKMPNFDISAVMTADHLKHVRHVVEKMKNMGPYLLVSANNSGTFTLGIHLGFGDVKTYYEGLHITKPSQDDKPEISTRVDVRKFLTFFAWEVFHPESVDYNFLDERLLNLHLRLDDHVDIHYFIPAVAM